MWDLAAALDPRSPTSTLCLRTLVVRIRLFPLKYFSVFRLSYIRNCILKIALMIIIKRSVLCLF